MNDFPQTAQRNALPNLDSELLIKRQTSETIFSQPEVKLLHLKMVETVF